MTKGVLEPYDDFLVQSQETISMHGNPSPVRCAIYPRSGVPFVVSDAKKLCDVCYSLTLTRMIEPWREANCTRSLVKYTGVNVFKVPKAKFNPR